MSSNLRNLPALLRDAERRVNAHVFKRGGDDSLASIPANLDRDVDLLLIEAADAIERLTRERDQALAISLKVAAESRTAHETPVTHSPIAQAVLDRVVAANLGMFLTAAVDHIEKGGNEASGDVELADGTVVQLRMSRVDLGADDAEFGGAENRRARETGGDLHQLLREVRTIRFGVFSSEHAADVSKWQDLRAKIDGFLSAAVEPRCEWCESDVPLKKFGDGGQYHDSEMGVWSCALSSPHPDWRRANQRTKNHVQGCDCRDCQIVRGAVKSTTPHIEKQEPLT